MPKVHKLEIIATQIREGENGAQVGIRITGDEHVLVAALAGLIKDEDKKPVEQQKLLRILVGAYDAFDKNMVRTMPERPIDEEENCPCPACSSQDSPEGGEK